MDRIELLFSDDEDDGGEDSLATSHHRAMMPSNTAGNYALAQVETTDREEHKKPQQALERKERMRQQALERKERMRQQALERKERMEQMRLQRGLDQQRRRVLREEHKRQKQLSQPTAEEKRRYDQRICEARARGLPWPDPPYAFDRDGLEWSPSDDETLLDMKSTCRSFYLIGMQLHRSEPKVMQRYRELFDHNSTS